MTTFYIKHAYAANNVGLIGTLSPASLEGTCAYLQIVFEHLRYPGTPEAVFPNLAAAYLTRAHACKPLPAHASYDTSHYTIDLHWNWEQWCVSDFATGCFEFNRWATPQRRAAVIAATLEATTSPETRTKLRALLDNPVELVNDMPSRQLSVVDHSGKIHLRGEG